MTNRREPTISGLRTDGDDARVKPGASDNHKLREPSSTAKRSKTSAAGMRSNTPVRPVIVRSKLAPFAFFVAVCALLGCAGLGWLFFEEQKRRLSTEQRLSSLEQKLTATGDESTTSLALLQASLNDAKEKIKTSESEIRKLWGVAYDRNRKNIDANKKTLSSVQSKVGKASEKIQSLSSQLALVSDLVDAQQTALTDVEKSNAQVSAQMREVNKKAANVEQRAAKLSSAINAIEQDIEAINGFRRSINQEISALKRGETTQ